MYGMILGMYGNEISGTVSGHFWSFWNRSHTNGNGYGNPTGILWENTMGKRMPGMQNP
jgi:hypothetical protein